MDRERKRELLSHLIQTRAASTRRSSSRAPSTAPTDSREQLDRDGIAAAAIHGNKSQRQRVRALADFKAGRVAVLVATEIAARGLDIDGLPHVVNFELPMVPEDYVHRIGRTGRAERDGDAVSLVCIDEMKLLGDIEKVLGRRIPTEVIEGFEPDPRIRPEPILRGGLGTSRPQSQGRPRPGSHAPRQGGAPRTDHGPHVAHRPLTGAVAMPRLAGRARGSATACRSARPRADRLRVDARPARPTGPGGRPSRAGIPPRRSGGPRSGGGRPAQRPPQGHGRSTMPAGYGDKRGSGPGTVLPGERLARNGGRSEG